MAIGNRKANLRRLPLQDLDRISHDITRILGQKPGYISNSNHILNFSLETSLYTHLISYVEFKALTEYFHTDDIDIETDGMTFDRWHEQTEENVITSFVVKNFKLEKK